MERRASIWLLILVTALLTAALTITIDRGVAALRVQREPTPTAAPIPTAAPPQQVIVVVETPEPELEPTPLPSDEAQSLLRQMQQQQARMQGFAFVNTALWQLKFAAEALETNDTERANRELDAARASLDSAAQLVSEDLKPQIDTERFELGRIRADLEIDPRGLDEDLRRMSDRLLTLVGPRPQ